MIPALPNPSQPAHSNILLTGGAGLLGQAIAAELRRHGHTVIQAVRSRTAANPSELPWDPHAPIPFADASPLEGLAAAIHLSGANVAAQRWTPAYKREILLSRTLTTSAIARTLAAREIPPRVLLSASATGIYGSRGDDLLTESSSLGTDFLAETCRAWEAATAPAQAAGIPVVHLRFGVVLSPRGGALAKVLPLFRAGLGGRLGNGRQWTSWIAIDDAVSAVLHLAGLGESSGPGEASGLKPTGSALLTGPVNCVAPSPITNAEYTRALASALHRPAFAAAPAFALRLALGEMADAALLSSCRALPEKLLSSGFRFRFPEIGPALQHLLATT